MSQIIALAQRIKVIQNIQKTAHAMQLISMSTLSRLKGQRSYVQQYAHELDGLFTQRVHTASHNPFFVLISSQKGFSGSFNQLVFELFKQHNPAHSTPVIPVGKLAEQFLRERNYSTVRKHITFSPTTLASAAQNLAELILAYAPAHDQVHIVSNVSYSIFLQKPQVTVLPLTGSHMVHEHYTLAQDKTQVEKQVFMYSFFIKLYTILLESLIAENSARTVSMDSSTSNARTMLQKMKLDYNKLRQAKVTRELTELSSSLLET